MILEFEQEDLFFHHCILYIWNFNLKNSNIQKYNDH